MKLQSSRAHTHTTRIVVRDYECDTQGIVNNAVYANYCEHARSEFIASRGFTLHSLHGAGESPVVVRSEMDYKHPLRAGDTCEVRTQCEAFGAFKLTLNHDIVRVSKGRGTTSEDEEVLCLRAVVIVAVVSSDGKPKRLSKTIFADIAR